MNSLVFKISSAFSLMILLIFSALGLFSNYFIESQFRQYAFERTATDSAAIAEQLASGYAHSGDGWESGTLEGIGVAAMERGLLIRVIDESGAVLWDARRHNEGFCSDMLMQMEMNMLSHNADFDGGYEEKEYPIAVSDQPVGSVVIGYYGPYFYSSDDVKYIDALQRLLFYGGLISLFFSVLLGVFVARRIARPITRVIDSASRIALGRYATPVQTTSRTREIVDLTKTINHLGETLAEQETLRKRLSSDVAHELRTPVTVLQSHLELMIEGVWQPEPDRLKKLYEETQRLSRLITDLSKIQALEDENLNLHLEETDVDQLFGELHKMMLGEFTKHNIDFEYHSVPVTARVDGDKLKQIGVNLLTNALRYTPEFGQVILHLDLSKCTRVPSFRLTVEDTGIGIPEKDLPHIFERFYRVDPSRSKASGGLGIGLAITKALVDAHHGTIRVESRPGSGSRFICEIPLG